MEGSETGHKLTVCYLKSLGPVGLDDFTPVLLFGRITGNILLVGASEGKPGG